MSDQPEAKSSPSKKQSSSARRKAEFSELVDELVLDDLDKEILKRRWIDQMVWFAGKSRHAKRRMTVMRVVIIIGSLMLPALASLPDSVPAELTEWGVIIVSLVVAITAGLEGYFKYGDLYTQYRESAELMKIEGWSYLALSGVYKRFKTHDDAFEKFTARVEDIIRRDVRAVVSQEERDKDKPQTP